MIWGYHYFWKHPYMNIYIYMYRSHKNSHSSSRGHTSQGHQRIALPTLRFTATSDHLTSNFLRCIYINICGIFAFCSDIAYPPHFFGWGSTLYTLVFNHKSIETMHLYPWWAHQPGVEGATRAGALGINIDTNTCSHWIP